MPKYVSSALAMIKVFSDFTDGGVGNQFTGTAISSGTVADVQEFGGKVRLSGAATTDDSGYQIQSKVSALQSKVKGVIGCEFAIKSSVAALGWKAGLAILDTTLYAGVNDAIFLEKTEGSAEVRLRVYDAGSSTVNELVGSVDSTSTEVDYRIEVRVSDTDASRARILVYVNGTLRLQTGVVTIPTEAMSLSAVMQSGSATGTQSIDIDYVLASQEREPA
jgi:hypothetical protein